MTHINDTLVVLRFQGNLQVHCSISFIHNTIAFSYEEITMISYEEVPKAVYANERWVRC